jgi:parvulin-like peptidyl-prolyl isomerase
LQRLRKLILTKGNQPELDEVGFSLAKIGDISQPFQTSRGWVVLKLVEKSPERVRSLYEVEDGVRNDLSTLKSDARLKEFMAKWKEKIPIKIYEKNLQKADVHERQNPKYFL